MTTRETTAILHTQDLLTPLIEAEIIEYTGKPYGFGFTQNLFFVNLRTWHEFKMLDGTELLMYAFLDDRGTLHTVNEVEDMTHFDM